MTILPAPIKGGDILPWAVAVTGALATPAGPARGLVRSGAGGDAVEPLPGNARARRSSAQPLPFAVRIVAKEPENEGGEPTKEAWIWLPDDSLVVNGQAVEIDCDAGAQADDDQAADALGGQWRKLDCYTGSAGKLMLDITLPKNQPDGDDSAAGEDEAEPEGVSADDAEPGSGESDSDGETNTVRASFSFGSGDDEDDGEDDGGEDDGEAAISIVVADIGADSVLQIVAGALVLSLDGAALAADGKSINPDQAGKLQLYGFETGEPVSPRGLAQRLVVQDKDSGQISDAGGNDGLTLVARRDDGTLVYLPISAEGEDPADKDKPAQEDGSCGHPQDDYTDGVPANDQDGGGAHGVNPDGGVNPGVYIPWSDDDTPSDADHIGNNDCNCDK